MAASLLGGLIGDGFPRANLRVSEPDASRRQALAGRFGIEVEADNAALTNWASCVILAVKPQRLREVLQGLAQALRNRPPLLISIAAGVRTDDILRWAGGPIPLVRVMPNTPALVKAGMSALFAGPGVSEAQRHNAEGILAAVGQTLWVERETDMDAVTAVSGSGPAYFFLMMEALQEAGESLGLAPDTARRLSLQTALGAARMALESGDEPAELRARVTSPGGTTERALAALEEGGLRTLMAKAAEAAAQRSSELADALGRDD